MINKGMLILIPLLFTLLAPTHLKKDLPIKPVEVEIIPVQIVQHPDRLPRYSNEVNRSGHREVSIVTSAYCARDIIGNTSWGARRPIEGDEGVVGTASVDPNYIPYGSNLYVPGYGWAVAEDTGGAIVGDRVDLFIEDYDIAMKWGIRRIDSIVYPR